MNNFYVWSSKQVHHEEKHPVNGNVLIYSDHETIFYVCWRQDRRRVWCHSISLGYRTLDEALRNLPDDAGGYSPPALYKRSKKRDSQREKVYTWERKTLRKIRSLVKRLRRSEMYEFFRHVCSELKLDKDLKLTTYKRSNAVYLHYKKTVNVPEVWRGSFFTKETILHELAHHITDTKYNGTEIQPHGAEFMKEYVSLLTRFSKVGQKRLVKSLTEARIKFDLYQETPSGDQKQN